MTEKYKSAFLKTKKSFTEKFATIFSGEIEESIYDEIVEMLLLCDIPYETAQNIIEIAKKHLPKRDMNDLEAVKKAVRTAMCTILEKCPVFDPVYPAIFLFIGVNGAGKTTTIAKLTDSYIKHDKKVVLAAADTFRAAACEQLAKWAEKMNTPIIKSSYGQDPSAVVFDAIASGRAKNVDAVICDTAGRLQNNVNLADELKKIYRVAQNKKDKFALYTILVLDAQNGNNSLVQTESFSNMVKVDACIFTKMDSSAKGGMVLGIADKMSLPVWKICTGEGIDDIVDFDAFEYIDSIL